MGSLMYLEVVSSIEYREASVYMVGVWIGVLSLCMSLPVAL
jgi:hypothetical protein